MNLIEMFMNFLSSLLGKKETTSEPKTEEPTQPVSTGGKLPGNDYPRIVRLTNISPELTGGIVSGMEIEGKQITLKRKDKLYAGISCEVQVTYDVVLEAITTDMFGIETKKTSVKRQTINASKSGKDKMVTHIIDYPNAPNGYIPGPNKVTVKLIDQNGILCDVREFDALVLTE